jgi:hypothetical protein
MTAPPPDAAPRTRREWPLVIGMVVAAVVLVASTRVGTSDGRSTRIPAVSQSAKQAAVTGFAAAAKPARAATDRAASPTRAGHTHRKPHPKVKAPSATAASPAPKPTHHAEKAPKPAATPQADSGGTSAPSDIKPPKQEPATPPPAALSVPADSGQTTVGGITFTVRAPSHKPAVGTDWTMTLTAMRGTNPVAGKVAMDVVYQGKVARHVTTAQLKSGSFAKKIVWPDRSAGYPLTIRVKMTAAGQACTFLYDLKVQPAG